MDIIIRVTESAYNSNVNLQPEIARILDRKRPGTYVIDISHDNRLITTDPNIFDDNIQGGTTGMYLPPEYFTDNPDTRPRDPDNDELQPPGRDTGWEKRKWRDEFI
ncbi:hypothetical protein NERG_00860 [Nematocida ausubeli]|uniref:Uncharacterized protein n=1 Tax=Nematocida ausubeli (strain ATCC PRA-371 / ERTm2) TaxID=1913371 RepID=H8ZBB1_NEMA1|nr:hypothetical protein NERG_00860 [Nematocida ausubeli]